MRINIHLKLLIPVLFSSICPLAVSQGAAAPSVSAPASGPTRPSDDRYWVEPMKKVHAKFTGTKGTFAHFGDSITVSMAFWTSLYWDHKNMPEDANAAFQFVSKYMAAECWNKWKGPKYGNEGSMTIRWADENIGKWLKDLDPEVALIMFGTNDLGSVPLEEYKTKLARVVQKCLDNGTIVLLNTIAPKSGQDEKARKYVEAIRAIAKELNVPVCDYYDAIMTRRPEDWNGASARFKPPAGEKADTYDVATLISRDGVHPSNPKKWQGDYTEDGLKNNGFVLRNYVTLMSYADVIRSVLQPGEKKPN